MRAKDNNGKPVLLVPPIEKGQCNGCIGLPDPAGRKGRCVTTLCTSGDNHAFILIHPEGLEKYHADVVAYKLTGELPDEDQ